MKTIDWKYTSVGQIVADDFAAASVFKKYGIDFCCHGEVMLEKACADLGLAVEEVEQALLRQGEAGNGRISFCLLYTSPSPRDISGSRMPSSA